MNPSPHYVFGTEEDRWCWDKYIAQCDLIELTESDRQLVKASFQYLRQVLGEGFLRRADRQRNPLFFWYFRNAAPRARLSMTRFVDALRALEGANNYDRLLRRIKRPKNFDHDLAEADSLIEVAHKFSCSGFDVEFEPSVQVTNVHGVVRTKKPDLKLLDGKTGQEVYVEVSRLRKSAGQNLTSRTYHTIWNVVHNAMWLDPEALKDITNPRHVLPFAIIHRGIEEDELRDIVSQLQALIEKARAGLEFSELIIPDTIEVAVASYDHHERGREWASARGMREADLVQGPNILTDEIARTKVKIREKLKQLPDDKPGVIVLPASENLIFFVYDIRGLVASLAEEVEKSSKVLTLIMFHSFDDGGHESFSAKIGTHTFCRQVRTDGSTQQSLIVHNANFNLSVAGDIIGKIKSAFCNQ